MGHQSFFETEKSPQTRMNTKKNVPDSKIRHIIWWGKMDSNHRRHCQQIYSLSPLATREFPHIIPVCKDFTRKTYQIIEICFPMQKHLKRLAARCQSIVNRSELSPTRGAGGRTRTPDLLITNQLLYQLSYTSIFNRLDHNSKPRGVCQHKFFQIQKNS